MKTLLPQFAGAEPVTPGTAAATSAAARAAFEAARATDPTAFAVCLIVFAPETEPFHGRRLVSVRGSFMTAADCDLSLESLAAAGADSLIRKAWEKESPNHGD